MAKDDKRLSQSIAARLLSPAFASFDSIAAGEIKQAQLDTLEMTARLARLAARSGVRVPADSQDLAAIIETISSALSTGQVAYLDDDQVTRAVQWLKALRNQLGFARPTTLLSLIDDLTLAAGLRL